MAKIKPKTYLKGDTKIIVRSAEINDASELLYVVPKLDTETDFMMRIEGEFNLSLEDEINFIQIKLTSENELFIVAEVDGKIVGTLGARGNDMFRTSHICSFGIGVLKEYWRKGVGSSLLTTMLKWAEEKNIKRIELKVVSENDSALRLYRRFGFEIEGTMNKDHFIGNNKYLDSYIMAKTID